MFRKIVIGGGLMLTGHCTQLSIAFKCSKSEVNRKESKLECNGLFSSTEPFRMYYVCSKPVLGTYMTNSLEGPVKVKRQSALKLALVEFAIVFGSEVGWNLFRKTGQSTVDSFGIALLTAIFLFAFHNR